MLQQVRKQYGMLNVFFFFRKLMLFMTGFKFRRNMLVLFPNLRPFYVHESCYFSQYQKDKEEKPRRRSKHALPLISVIRNMGTLSCDTEDRTTYYPGLDSNVHVHGSNLACFVFLYPQLSIFGRIDVSQQLVHRFHCLQNKERKSTLVPHTVVTSSP